MLVDEDEVSLLSLAAAAARRVLAMRLSWLSEASESEKASPSSLYKGCSSMSADSLRWCAADTVEREWSTPVGLERESARLARDCGTVKDRGVGGEREVVICRGEEDIHPVYGRFAVDLALFVSRVVGPGLHYMYGSRYAARINTKNE